MPRPVLGNYDGAVVSGFFLELGLCSGLAPLQTFPNVLKTLLDVKQS
jgi:hypothetical protein